jgi:hypothetical protein
MAKTIFKQNNVKELKIQVVGKFTSISQGKDHVLLENDLIEDLKKVLTEKKT